MNHYATKKSAAQSMLDVALLMANSSQLKTVLHVGPDYRFYIPLIVLLSLSITLQVAVGLLLVFIGQYTVGKRTQISGISHDKDMIKKQTKRKPLLISQEGCLSHRHHFSIVFLYYVK